MLPPSVFVVRSSDDEGRLHRIVDPITTYNFPPTDPTQRQRLLEFVRTAPLTYGNWQAFKRIYKQVETAIRADGSHPDPELLAAYLARLDAVPLQAQTDHPVMTFAGIVHAPQHFIVREGIAFVLHSPHNPGGNRVSIFSLGGIDPLKPTKVSEIRLSAPASYLVFCGPYLLAVANSSYRSPGSITVYDISDPAQPRKAGQIAQDIQGKVACSYPFVYSMNQPPRNQSAVVTIVSIADPDAPRQIGQIDGIGEPVGIEIANAGKTLALVYGPTGFAWNRLPKPPSLKFVDISNPFQPQVRGELRVTDMGAGDGDGQYLYVATGGHGRSGSFKVIDVRDPLHPAELSVTVIPSPAYVSKVRVEGNLAFVCLADRTCYYDITYPHQPRFLNEIRVSPQNIAFSRSFAYLSGYDGVQVWNLSNPLTPGQVGKSPTRETFGYMKRRARRLLKLIGKRSGDRYVELASRILMSGGNRELSPANDWIAFDILYGGGTEWQQQSHGRGAYKRLGAPVLRRHYRQDRFPDAWDRRPDLAAALLTSPSPAIAHELAARVLVARKMKLPRVPDGVLSDWLLSSSPLLAPLAVRRLADRFDEGANLTARIAAVLFFKSTPGIRPKVADAVARRLQPDWHRRFAEELGTLSLPALRPGARTATRVIASLRLLAERYSEQIAQTALLPMAATLMRSRSTQDHGLAQALAQRGTGGVMPFLSALLPLTEEQREPILAGLEQSFSSLGIIFDSATLYSLLQSDISETIQAFAWRLVAASKTPDTLLRQVWKELLERTTETPSIRSAMSSPAALALLNRSGITTEEISGYLATRPFLAALLSPQTFARLIETVPVSVLFSLTAAMDDTVWERLQNVWLSQLQQGTPIVAFWTGIEAALKTDTSGRIAGRLLENESFRRTITRVDAEHADTLLKTREPDLDAALTGFVEHHLKTIVADQQLLLLVATHCLPGVRLLGLQAVRDRGMTLPIALRLMESGLPEADALGRTYFESVPDVPEALLEAALALCDSPVRSVRRYGREYVSQRREALPPGDLLTALFENPDPETQYFVAEMVKATPAPAEIRQFERDVLRRRNAARKAKEAVKRRQETVGTVDIPTLLEMARGSSTPRDAEWALSQLARRALAGEQIPGFALEGVTDRV